MDDLAVALIFLVISLVGWAMQKAREAGKKTPTKPELSLEDIFTNASDLELDVEPRSHQFGFGESDELVVGADNEFSVPAPSVEPSRVDEPISSPIFTPTTASRRKSRVLAGIPFDAKGVRQGIILSEVLGKPKSLR